MMADSRPLLSLFIQERDIEYRLDGARSYLAPPIDSIAAHHKEGGVASSLQQSKGINDDWRLKIAEWSFDVVDHFNFDRDVVAIALNYIDRFMVFDNRRSFSRQVGRREYQLLTLASLYLAMKLHGEMSDESASRRKPSLRVFVDLSQNGFTSVDIEQMERKLLDSLKWRVNPPMPVSFVKCLLSFLPGWRTQNGLPNSCQQVKSAIYEMARYLTEISVCTSEFSFLFKPSLLAYTSILAAVDLLKGDRSLANTFPPIQILAAFIQSISRETSLNPNMQDVRKARFMLAEMCPALSDTTEVVLAADVSMDSVILLEELDVSAQGTATNLYHDDDNREHRIIQKDAPSPTEVMFAFHEDELAYEHQ